MSGRMPEGLRLRRLKPDSLNLSVNTVVGERIGKMLSPVALAAGDFLTWRIRLPDSGSKFSGRQIVQFAVRKTKNHCLANGDSSSPPCEKGENVWNSIPHRWMPHAEAS